MSTTAANGADGVAKRIQELVSDHLGVEPGDVSPEAHILDDLGADSLDVVELVMALEEGFDLEIPDEDVEGLRTIADVQKYVATRIEAQA